jgi:hypothetical protein
MNVIPIYAFVQGDTMGIVVLGRPEETAAALAERMVRATEVRAGGRGSFRSRFRLVAGGRALNLEAPLGAQGIEPLDRLDLVWE